MYLLAYSGIPVYYHYCGGELESIHAMVKADNCCGEEEEADSDCCKNEVQVLDQKSESLLSNLVLDFSPVVTTIHYLMQQNACTAHTTEVLHDGLFDREKIPIAGREILSCKSVLII